MTPWLALPSIPDPTLPYAHNDVQRFAAILLHEALGVMPAPLGVLAIVVVGGVVVLGVLRFFNRL